MSYAAEKKPLDIWERSSLLEFAMGHPISPVNYFTPTGIPLSCCKLGLLKCTIPAMDRMPSKEERK